MQYSPELETDAEVQKIPLSVGNLFFIPLDGTDRFAFCSDNPKIQEWCESVEDVGPIKDKSVPKIYYQFAVSALQDYLHNKPTGSHRRNSISIIAGLDKNEIITHLPDNSVIVDAGKRSVSVFAGLTDIDEIYKKTIEDGIIDHHTIDQLRIMANLPKKCTTQMVVDYIDDVADFCARHNVREIIIHRDSDLDAVCAAWLIREKMAVGKLPDIASEIAEIVNLVDYADFRLPPEKYITSFPGCISAVMSAIKTAKREELYQNADNIDPDEPDGLSESGRRKAKHLDSIANAEVFKILDILTKEKENNPEFNLETTDILEFILSSDDISDYTKEMMQTGLEQIYDSKQQFEKDVADAEVMPFNFINPVTNLQETGTLVIASASNPITILNIGYAYYGKNTIIAVYGGLHRDGGDMYDIGITPDDAYKLSEVMQDICVIINKTEEEKRLQIERICSSLENQAERTPEEEKRLEDLRRSLWDLDDTEACQAFVGADQFDLIDKDPSMLIAENSLISASRHSLITEKCFTDTLKQWAADTSTDRVSAALQFDDED